MDCPCPHVHPLAQPERAVGAPSRIVFLDRDGVLIPDTGYPSDPAGVVLLPGVAAALSALIQADWRLVVVTNQSGVARGYFDLARLATIHNRLVELLLAEGVTLDALYYCPHHPEGIPPFRGQCDYRKPNPGMILAALRAFPADPRSCWMIGDKEDDVTAGHIAGCRTIRIGEPSPVATGWAENLPSATVTILNS